MNVDAAARTSAQEIEVENCADDDSEDDDDDDDGDDDDDDDNDDDNDDGNDFPPSRSTLTRTSKRKTQTISTKMTWVSGGDANYCYYPKKKNP